MKRRAWRPVLAAAGVGGLIAWAGASAQPAQVSPLDADAPVTNAPYVSPLGRYRHAGEVPLGDWRQANDQVAPAAGDDPHAGHATGAMPMPMDMGSGMKMDMGDGSNAGMGNGAGATGPSHHNGMRRDPAQPPAAPAADSPGDGAMPLMEHGHAHHH